MVLFAISLYVILTSAQNNSYVECFNNKDCLEYHDKWYCYAGKCTDSCPPGYNQKNYGSEPFFTCTCDSDSGFKENGYFPGNWSGVQIPKCACENTYCKVTVYATGLGYTDGLVPNGAPPNCKAKTGEIPTSVLTYFVFYLVIGTMFLFAFLNWRSSSGVIYDFHRYIGLYVLASIAVIVFVQTVYPFTAGFTRSMGFGVIIHNSAEWNLLLRLNFGKTAYFRNCTNMCVMLYYVLLLIAMVVLPLEWLFYVAMIQGGFLDWTLVFFTYIGAARVKNETNNWQHICDHICSNSVTRFGVWFGFASIFHLLTVQVLFIGFALNNPALIGFGSVLLVPTFLSYTFWAYGEDRMSLLCGPGLVMDYTKPKSDSDEFSLAAYTHTTQTVDVLWQAMIGDRAKYFGDRAQYYSDQDKGVAGGNENETAKLIETDTNVIVIDDCENFKFGVQESVWKLSSCCPCPGYWILALIVVTGNATLIIFFPTLIATGDCFEGFEYGAW